MTASSDEQKARHAERLAQIKRVIARRGLGGLANNTKWQEFIVGVRDMFGLGGGSRNWRPSYRFKFVDRDPSDWDVEWWWHVPEPIGVEWFDVSFLEETRDKRLPPNIEIIDHSKSLAELLTRVGLEFEVGTTMIRIFGYAPKDMQLFDT